MGPSKRRRMPAYYCTPSGLYVLDETYQGVSAIKGLSAAGTFWALHSNGNLVLHRGFTWNGPDVVLDHPLLMMPSALHDALCNGLSAGVIPRSRAKQVHFTYRDAMKTWGVPWIRRVVQFRAVRHGHGLYSKIAGWFK